MAAKKGQRVGLDVNAKRALLEPGAKKLSLPRQGALLGLNCSSGYAPMWRCCEREQNLRLMHRIDDT